TRRTSACWREANWSSSRMPASTERPTAVISWLNSTSCPAFGPFRQTSRPYLLTSLSFRLNQGAMLYSPRFSEPFGRCQSLENIAATRVTGKDFTVVLACIFERGAPDRCLPCRTLESWPTVHVVTRSCT